MAPAVAAGTKKSNMPMRGSPRSAATETTSRLVEVPMVVVMPPMRVAKPIGISTEEAGDLLLLGNDLRGVVTALGLSGATMIKIRQNLFWAFIYNSLAVPIAAMGWLNPMIAGAAMALSSLSVIINSALLNRYRRACAAAGMGLA